jgi:hypothetical protein
MVYDFMAGRLYGWIGGWLDCWMVGLHEEIAGLFKFGWRVGWLDNLMVWTMVG